ncbi:MAG TPA: sigma-70 family RNA polymerase sigma factor, partial [Candidatus Krumholzibacteria bacterium]|nr:sigma-70 family RNA polymerase sigma factor [Candidatus Krumholzibacteria bacterium]
ASNESETHELDREALSAIRQGDSSAFASLVRRHGPPLHALLSRMLRDEHEAQDLVQESFVKAWKALAKFDSTRAFFPWLRTIGVNTALDAIERRRRQPVAENSEEILNQLPAPQDSEEGLQRRELVEVVEEELSELSGEFATVFRLRVQEELSYAEIAQTLQIPLGTVMSRLARARLQLAQALRSRLGTDLLQALQEGDDDGQN